MLGITTEHASRTVAEFKRNGVITELAPNRYRCDMAQLGSIAASEQ
jgi:hypothetical protein